MAWLWTVCFICVSLVELFVSAHPLQHGKLLPRATESLSTDHLRHSRRSDIQKKQSRLVPHTEILKRSGQFVPRLSLATPTGKKNEIVSSNANDDLPDILSHAISNHHEDGMRWMDFYNNGASWEHFRAPEEHTNGYVHEDDGQFKANLAVDEADNAPHDDHLNNMVEAYPGEIVSGENSLSKYIAPAMYDDTPSGGSYRHKIHRHKPNKLKFQASTPEQKSAERENTKRLVDSLNSLMTPIKSKENSFERKFEHAMWGEPPDESSNQINHEIEEESQIQDQKALYEQTRLQESAKSRESLEKIEHDDFPNALKNPDGLAGKAEGGFHEGNNELPEEHESRSEGDNKDLTVRFTDKEGDDRLHEKFNPDRLDSRDPDENQAEGRSAQKSSRMESDVDFHSDQPDSNEDVKNFHDFDSEKEHEDDLSRFGNAQETGHEEENDEEDAKDHSMHNKDEGKEEGNDDKKDFHEDEHATATHQDSGSEEKSSIDSTGSDSASPVGESPAPSASSTESPTKDDDVKGTPKPIEVMQDDSGKIVPMKANNLKGKLDSLRKSNIARKT